MEKRLFLLDAYALIYRAYYGFIRNPRYNSKGLNTSAIFGFTNTLIDILRNENPTHIAVGFDPPSPTFRHKLFKDYKGQRPPTPEDIKKSVPYIRDIIKAFNIPIIEVNGYEADDTIGTIAKKAEKEGFEVFMMTPDKDYAQLVSENIFMYKPKRAGVGHEVFGVDGVSEKYKISDPILVTDILALWGDASDNIPGAPGIGEKTAIKLVSQYGDIEEIFKNLDKLKGKQKENIENNIEQIRFSKVLVTIEINVPIDFNEEDLLISKPNSQELVNLLEELEFRTMLDRVPNIDDSALTKKKEPIKVAQAPTGQQSLFGMEEMTIEAETVSKYENSRSVNHNYIFVDTKKKRQDLIDKLSKLKEFCFDTETTSINIHNAELVGMSFCFKSHEAYYIPTPVDYNETKQLVDEFKHLFEDKNICKIGQNIKYDILMLKRYDVHVAGHLFDTMLAHYLIQPELRHNLTFLSEHYLNFTPIPIEDLIGKKGKSQLSMRSVPLDKITEYAAEDADLTWQLVAPLRKELEENNLTTLFNTIELPLIYVLADMEITGVKLDTTDIYKFADDLRTDIIKLEEDIQKMAGVEFNIGSPKQLGEVLFDRMKIIANPKKTKTKQYSTGEEILVTLKDKHEIIGKILEFRSLKKLLSTYVEALPKLINERTGKIHTSYNQAVAATGRLSSTNPNLQNIPIREARGREVRKAFISSGDDYTFFSADYSQVELRLMAHYSEDANMIEAFNNNEDIHSATAAKINNVPISEVTKDMRSQAKSANFGIIYGVSAFGLSRNLNISRTEAKELIDNYFATYPKVKEFMDNSIYLAREKGYVETIFGRKRILNDINSRNPIVRGNAERNAINAPLQGSAADIIKIAMINVYKRMQENNMKSKMIIQVHDELNFDAYKPELEELKKIVEEEMVNAVKLKVQLVVDMGVGNNWLEAH